VDVTVTKVYVERLGAGARRQIALQELEQARVEAAKVQAPAAKRPAKRLAKRSRFGNVRTQVDGIKFDSKLEARHYTVLRAMERHGEISALTVHPTYELEVAGIWICRFIPDFRFVDSAGKLRFQDTKGGKDGAATITDTFRIKARLFRALTGHTVEVIGS
jgi:hypothetical protein